MTDQKKLLTELVSKLKNEPKNKSQAVASLQSAKIITKSGAFTSHYPNLKKAAKTSK